MKKSVMAIVAFSAAVMAQAGLVARWDFNNFDPENPKSTNVFKATVGEDAYPCYYKGRGSALVTDGTIGQMYVCEANATDANAVSAFNALGGGNYAIAIPTYSHIALPIPAVLQGQNHAFTIKIRCWIPAQGWHAFFNRDNVNGFSSGDSDLFITNPNRSGRNNTGIGGDIFGNNNNYKTGIGIGSWQTVTVSAGPARHDVFLNETTEALYGNNANNFNFFNNPTERLTTHNGKKCLLLCADNDGEDGLMYVDYVEIFDDASAYEGKAPQYTKDGLTGEWTFAGDEGLNLKATVGSDATRWTRTGSGNFTIGTDGILPGDGYLRAGQNNGIRIPHGLPSGANYTIVIDARVPDNSVKNQTWHGLVNMGTGDATLFLRVDSGKVNIRTCGDSTFFSGLVFGEFGRIVATYQNGGSANIYVNGALKRTVPSNKCGSYPTTKGGFFTLLGDENGEDYDSDVSYCAIYDRVLSAAEITELHSRPLAQRSDGSFIPTVPAAGLWSADADTGTLVPTMGDALTPTTDGGYTWTRYTAPAAATWVADLTLPSVQTEGGVFVKNASNVASGIYGTSSTYSGSFITTTNPGDLIANTYPSNWGYWSETALDRNTPHRLAVTWAASGRVHYYVDGRLWGQIFPLNGNTAAKPSAVMNFFNGLGATVTRLAAYDVPLTPDEVAGLGGVSQPEGNAPVVTFVSSSIPAEVKAMADAVSFTVSATQSDGEFVAYLIDWGDGTTTPVTKYLASGTQQTFSHVYTAPGTYTPVCKAISQSGFAGSMAGTPVTVVAKQFAVRDVLLTLPWQQNVYTNRFTIMCEGVKNTADPDLWKGLEVQWGENYANCTKMTRVESNGGTWIYKAHITVDASLAGQTIPYRLGYFGQPFTYEEAADNTEGTVKLWNETAGESFKVGIWGDNQQGARGYDWDSDKYAYVRAIFSHMVAQGVDFGISSGDMASSADYNNQIKPGILQATDGILGRTRPYYVAWGNHDISYRNNQPYFETGSIDDPAWGTSEDGAYYLYRGNVLFIFIHQSAYNATTATWLANLLATDRAKAASFRVMVQHYPFWLECWSGNVNTALLEAAKAGGVDIIFSGHMHGYERYLKDGIVQLTNGGAGYLDHVETVTTFYGDDIFVGGHKNVPYLWARQASPTVNNVLGGAEPVRMGCIQSYGELRFENNTLHYLAHGFNADGSYIGVFDDFTLESKTCPVTPQAAPSLTPCANPASFAAFTDKPVTNAKWAEYKTALGETFAYDPEKADAPVVNVSKTEIEKFLVWLNGTTGDYRLPTVAELAATFGGELRREVAEWTSSVDPNTGWCRILGSPAKAQEGTWSREGDCPSIATAGCHADYLGFRLATGPAPIVPVDSLTAPLAALAAIAAPARAYKWEDGALVDISEEFYNPTGALVYDVPVILTDEGEVTRESEQPLTFNAGFTAPNATSFYATGPLTVSGEVKAGRTTNQWQWRFGSISNTLTIANVTYRGVGVTFRAGDLTLRVKGHNDFSGAMYGFNNETQHPTNIVTAVDGEAASLAFASMRNLGTFPFRIGENVTVKLAGEFRVTNSTALWVDGVLDAEAFNIQGNMDPRIYGAGTFKLGYYGSCVNSWPYFGISNLVVTTKRFWRANSPSNKSYNGILFDGDEMHISSTCDWEIPPKDQFGYNTFFLSHNRAGRVKVVFEGPHNVSFAPTYTAGTLSSTAFNNPWDLQMAGTGTLTLTTPIKGDVTVTDGTVKIAKYPTSGKVTVASGNGKWLLDGMVALAKGQTLFGTVAGGEGVNLTLGAAPAPGLYEFIKDGGTGADGLAVTHDLEKNNVQGQLVQGDGTVSILVGDFAKTAVWTGEGNRANPQDPANWAVTNNGARVEGAIPDADTAILIFGATSLNVPKGTSIEYGTLVLSDHVALTADCDWRGFAAVALRDALTIDLMGHRLAVSSFSGTTAGAAAFTDSTTDRAHPGELHIDVAEGATFTNDKVALTGNLKLVKDGLGTFIPTQQNQTYTGGTLIAAGTAALPVSGGSSSTYAASKYQWGGYGTKSAFDRVITVAEGATLDTKGNYDFSVYHLVLDGGTLANTGCNQDKSDWGVYANLTLTAPSHGAFAFNTRFGLNANSVLDLGGYTFDVVLTGNSTFYLQGVVVKNGTLKVSGAGWFDEYATAVNGSDANFDIAVPSWIAHTISCGSLIDRWEADTSTLNRGGAGQFVVSGTYKPVGAAFYRVQLVDGATLDLSDKTEAWNLASDNATYAASFADGATITIGLGKRTLSSWTKVVSWATAPANCSTLTFKGERKTQKVQVRDDGVWMIDSSMIIIIR